MIQRMMRTITQVISAICLSVIAICGITLVSKEEKEVVEYDYLITFEYVSSGAYNQALPMTSTNYYESNTLYEGTNWKVDLYNLGEK